VSRAIHLWYGDGVDSPRTGPSEALAAAGLAADAEDSLVTLGWTVERHAWLDDPSFRARTVVAGFGLTTAIAEGRVGALPVRLSAVPRMIQQDSPDVAIVTGVRRGDRLAFRASVGWGDVLARHAGRVVVEVDEHGADLGAPLIEGNIVATIARPGAPTAAAAAARPADELDLRIGELVASLLPEAPTLQFGPGGIGEGIARSLGRPVSIWSGLVTDAMAELHDRGLLLAPAVAGYAWGGEPIERLAAAGMLRLMSSTTTHDVTALSAMPRLVGCNTALQFGLDGAVNIERIGGRIIAPIGGHSDFCLGASRSVGGLSIIAIRSTAANGTSTIVPAVHQVSTQRSDVDVLVTEHGIADLRGADDRTRRTRIIAVAAPQFRDSLSTAEEPR
jgi:acyl-CoA hydrolase